MKTPPKVGQRISLRRGVWALGRTLPEGDGPLEGRVSAINETTGKSLSIEMTLDCDVRVEMLIGFFESLTD